MRIRWIILGFVGGAIAGAPTGLSIWLALHMAGWPILIPSGSFELLRWGGSGALAGGILAGALYPQVRQVAPFLSDSAIRADWSGRFLPLLGGWPGVLILGAGFGMWVGFFTGGIGGTSYEWDDPTGATHFFGGLSGAVVGAPAGVAIGALFGAIASARSGSWLPPNRAPEQAGGA